MMMAFGLAAAVLAAGASAQAVPLEGRVSESFDCTVRARGSFGRIRYLVVIDLGNGHRVHEAVWDLARQARRPWIGQVTYHDSGTPLLSGEATLMIGLRNHRRAAGRVRLEVTPGGRPPLSIRTYRWWRDGHSAALQAGDEITLAAVRAALGPEGSAPVALVREDGRRIAPGVLDAALLGEADAALDAVRGRMEEKLADPRRHCRRTPTIVVRAD